MKPSSHLVGRELAGFRIEEHIGSGGAAAVYRGVNLLDDSIVRAIKVVHPALLLDEDFASRFAEEARILERLQHPNVVRFHGARWDGDYLLMELEMLQGQALSDLVSSDGATIAVERVLGWITQAAEGVAAAHALGIVHRDIKPANLFLTHQQQVKVLDFGIARALDDADRASSLTRAGSVPGTPAYMAPEVCRHGVPSTTSDVYALGITLLELLAGYHPFMPPDKPRRSSAEVMLAQVTEELAPLSQLRSDAPAQLGRVAARATTKDPQQRYATARELADALSQVLAGTSSEGPLWQPADVPPAPEPTPYATPQPASQDEPEPTPQAAPEPTPQAAPEPTPHAPPPSARGPLVAAVAAALLVLVLGSAALLWTLQAARQQQPVPARVPAPATGATLLTVGAGVRGAEATCELSLEGGETRQAPAPCRFMVSAGKQVTLELRSGGYRLFREQWTVARDRMVALEWTRPAPGRPDVGPPEQPAATPPRPRRTPRRRKPRKEKAPLRDDIVVEP